MIAQVPPTATTTDAFTAIAEPQRRRILTLLKTSEMPANDIAHVLGIRQPSVSKHLGVLKQVGLVYSRPRGKQRIYGLDATALRAVHEWTGGFAQFWQESFERLERYAQQLEDEENPNA